MSFPPITQRRLLRPAPISIFSKTTDFFTWKILFMKKSTFCTLILLAGFGAFHFNCNKDKHQEEDACSLSKKSNAGPCYNLDVLLTGNGNDRGFIKFRQDPDAAKIISLDTWVDHLEPNHEYKLQRAVDPINEVDGNCTSTTWLTLGSGLDPLSIVTDAKGEGHAALWRDVTAIANGSSFDIHFQLVDAVTNAVVLSSGCYQYTVR